MSLIMRKPFFFFAYAKTKTQITAKLISAFVFAIRIVQSLFYLLKSGISRAYTKTWSGVMEWSGAVEWSGFLELVFWSQFKSFKVRDD